METVQQPSIFARLVDKLRNKSEAELNFLYMQLVENNLADTNNNEIAECAVSYDAGKHMKKRKATKRQNNLENVFGIWKKENITLNSIREEAWQRTK